MRFARPEILKRLRARIDDSAPIVAVEVGSGISAESEEGAGVDLIVLSSAGRFRGAGGGSVIGFLAYGNANQTVREVAYEVLSAVERTPVLAGVCGTDPFLLRRHFLGELRELGFAGVQNVPTVGLIDGQFRRNLEETGMSYSLEVDCIAEAHAMDLLTAPLVFEPDQARWMADAGADIVIVHLGLGVGKNGSAAKWPPQRLNLVRRIAGAARERRDGVLVLCQDVSLKAPEDAQHLLDQCPEIDGFFATSSAERLRNEAAVSERARRFASVRLSRADGGPPTRPGRHGANNSLHNP